MKSQIKIPIEDIEQKVEEELNWLNAAVAV
jgi:hypothetical protein